MNKHELSYIVCAVLVMFLIIGVRFVLDGNAQYTIYAFGAAITVVCLPIVVKNAVAYSLDASVEHKIWNVSRFGFRPSEKFAREKPFGLIVPLVFALFSLGAWKVMTLLSYETRALKHRAAKRFGLYSYTAMTDWHNGLIGASGVVSLFVLAVLTYLPGWEFLTKTAILYAFWNMIPVSDLDGTQIFFGSRILWTVLAVITLIFLFYAIVLF